MKKILTLNCSDFKSACKKLEDNIISSGFLPDIVVGIESGGRYVADEIFAGVKHCYIAKHRPGNKSKKVLLSKIISKLPMLATNTLRRIESCVLSVRLLKRVQAFEGNIPSEIFDVYRILVVDDAIDTGNTMQSIVMALEKKNPNAQISTAVIVKTLPSSRIVPDYCLYNDVLIRFPWSNDAVR